MGIKSLTTAFPLVAFLLILDSVPKANATLDSSNGAPGYSTSCRVGKYGDSCDKSCAAHCINKECNRNSGVCTSGCEDGYYNHEGKSTYCHRCHVACKKCTSIAECSECHTGYYGPFCDNKCSDCKNSLCNISACLDGCQDGWYEGVRDIIAGQSQYLTCYQCPGRCETCISYKECSSCLGHFWGKTCDKACPSVCDMCDINSGQCHRISCPAGYYLNALESCTKCPRNCLSCTSENRCNNCTLGYSGPTCGEFNCSTIDHCVTCQCNGAICHHRDYDCTQCAEGYHGRRCRSKCNVRCAGVGRNGTGQTCRQSDGSCISCMSGSWGDFCEIKCAEGCEGYVCDKVDGNCNCSSDYFGELCNKTCSELCPRPGNASQICGKTDGRCLFNPSSVHIPDYSSGPKADKETSNLIHMVVNCVIGAVVVLCFYFCLVRVFCRQ